MNPQKARWILRICLILFIGIGITLLWMNFTDHLQTPDTKSPEILVYLTKEDRVIRLPLESYIEGVVAAEMPADFHIEALKAQSLAARTYIVKRLLKREFSDMNQWGETAKKAHVSDTVKHQAFLTDQDRKKHWGNDYTWKMNRIRQAVNETAGKVITYQGQPIYAAFFSTSNGWTEASEDYFQTSYAYLRSVPSWWDRKSPKYLHRAEFTLSQLQAQLKKETGKTIRLENASAVDWISILEKTSGNRVAKIIIGDQLFTGREVREALGLSSSDFSWKVDQSKIQFHTKGFGHGVGMSQWGAHLMAQHGKTYQQIIHHYYQNVKIQSWDWNR